MNTHSNAEDESNQNTNVPTPEPEFAPPDLSTAPPEPEVPASADNSPSPGANMPEPPLPPPAPATSRAVASIGILGRVDALSDMEEAEYEACEAVIVMGWHSFVDVGSALARIRELRLYRAEFDSFEVYCREKWQYGRIYVHYLISAAQILRHLFTICEHRKPDHESQVRPLTGLSPEQAHLAWERAVEKAGGRKITARLVKAAVKELQSPAEEPPVPQQPRQTKAEQRRLINETFGQLLMLLSPKAPHETLTEKVEALHRHIQSLFAKSSKS